MKEKIIGSLVGFSIALFVPLIQSSGAEDPAITSGVLWLKSRPALDGSMGKAVDVPASTMAILGLSSSGEDVSLASGSISALEPGDAQEAAFRLLATQDPTLAPDLLAFQEGDGSFGSIRLTAISALALARVGPPDTATLTYLDSIQNDDGSFGPDKSLLDSAISTLALHASGQSNTAGLDFLLRSQHPGGSFGGAAANAWAILALKTYGGHPVELNAAVNRLAAAQNNDGGWSIGCAGQDCPAYESDVYLSGLCAWALEGTGADLSGAVSFIKGRQDLSGLWVDDSRAIKVTGTVVEVLRHIEEGAALRATGMSYLTIADSANNDQEARRIATLIGGDANVGDKFDDFMGLQDPAIGSWPLAEGYGGDFMVTALALEVMTRSHFYDGTIQNRAVSYLRDNVNADGSWGYKAGGDGTIAATAEIMLALEPYRKRFGLDNLLETAGDWIEGRQNADGSFGPDGSAWETALSLLALYSVDFTGEVVTSGYDKLLSMQLGNGSWEDDEYATALALWAIYDAKPNLFLRDQDVSFSVDNPTEGDQITVSALITNKGGFPAEDVVVRFYNGDPKMGGLQIGEDTITSLGRKEQATAEITWSVTGIEGVQYVFAVADPEDRIEESNESDNQGVHDLDVSSKPDLVITAADIRTLPENPDLTHNTSIQIFALVRNTGGRDATGFSAALTSVDPTTQDSTTLYSWDNVTVTAGGTTVLFAEFMPFGGTNDYTVLVDVLDQVSEQEEGNNSASITLELSDRVDLSVSNLFYSDQAPSEGELVTVTAVVYNTFFHEAQNVKVRFWLGNPQDGGSVLGEGVIGSIQPGKTGMVETVFNTEGHAGANYIYVMVDPDDEIVEANEYNNQIKGALHVTSKPDLLLSGYDIYFNTTIEMIYDPVLDIKKLAIYPPNPFVAQGDDLKIKVLLSNRGFTSAEHVLVRFFLGNPDEGGVMLDLDRVVSEVVYRSGPRGGAWSSATTSQYTAIVTIHYNTMRLDLGIYDLWVVLDPEDTVPELDETNNRAHALFQVVEPPDLVISSAQISFSPVHPEEGDAATIQAVVKNVGFSACKDFVVRFYDGDPRISGELVAEHLVPLIDPVWTPWALGGDANPFNTIPSEVTLASEYDTEGKLGFRDIFVQVDAGDKVSESDEGNNLAYKRLQVVPASAPDLAIRSETLMFDPESVASGSPLTVSATVENLRHYTARDVNVRFYRYDPNLGTVEIGSGGTVNELSGRESAVVSTVFDTTGVVGRVVVSAVADPADEIPESDETNNRGERPVVIKLPPEYLPAGLTVDVRWTTAFLSWIRSQFTDMGHYVLRDGEIANEDLMDVAKGAAVSASDVKDDHVAELAVDGDYQTWWRRQSMEEGWLELDLGRDYYLNTLVISWLDMGIGRSFRVSTWNGEEFEEVLVVQGNEDRNSVHYFDQSIKSRKIRLSGITRQPGGAQTVGICEINVLALEPVE